jgi:hypothetical protein
MPLLQSRFASNSLFRTAPILLLLAAALVLNGCHSAYVNATVSNRTASPISLVQVEYPSASFGTQTITPGADFKYRFKVLGSTLTEGAEGQLSIVVASDGIRWQAPPSAH